MGAAYLLPRVIGLGRASELLLLGETATAQRALAIGLANAVVEDSELSAQTSSVARRLAEGPALAPGESSHRARRESRQGGPSMRRTHRISRG